MKNRIRCPIARRPSLSRAKGKADVAIPNVRLQQLIAILGWFTSVLVVFATLLTSVRLLLTSAFVTIEYNTPGFPDDPYGMTKEQRLRYAPLALDFLLNSDDISFLADQRFEDGSPLYNERELSHMDDVKVLAQQFLSAWLLTVVLLLGIGAAAWHFAFLGNFKAWIGRGGRLTVGFIVLLLVVIALSFNWLFTGFHTIFFEGDSWLFLYSDTLIRLFPLRFWRDVFIALGLLSLAVGAALWRGLERRKGEP
jgi:integral membrane protein (TIGR01906 family)